MSHLNQDQIRRLCQDLVYQVGYAFYDVPYIILLNLMVQYGVARETDLTSSTQLQATEIRKYMGMLLTHRLIKRHANKERIPIPEYLLKKGDLERTRLKEVIYYYLDYREFANVVKYRIAMMRKGIDEKVMQDVGHKGYICPTCSRLYTPLQIRFNPASNAFECEDDQSELIEYVPDETDSSDKMQRFNKATQPIRDALRAVEGVTLPTVNIHAWVAENVTSVIVPEEGREGEGEAGKKGKVQVVLGGEGEREKIEKERLAEQQRTQNALPIWHTHSTVTGSATTLGIADETASARHTATKLKGRAQHGGVGGEGEDEMLMQHYEGMDGGEEAEEGHEAREVSVERVKEEVKEEVKESTAVNGVMPKTNGDDGLKDVVDTRKMVMVNGARKPLDDITEEDQEEMTPDEYQAYYDAALAT